MIIVLERPSGQGEALGDGLQGGRLRAAQQPDRLGREQDLAEHERDARADERVLESVCPGLAVGDGDGALAAACATATCSPRSRSARVMPMAVESASVR
jgi:hypothetical protein